MNDFILCEREKKTQKVSQYSRVDSTRPPRNAFEALRRSLHLTQEDFGQKLGLSKSVVQQYESGRSAPTTNSWLRMKETALHNGIELTEELYHAFMQEKAIRLQDSIEKRVDKINQKILELQQRSSDRGTTTIPSFWGHRVTSP
jgi:DNA-binding transcriptional regulator YiaG